MRARRTVRCPILWALFFIFTANLTSLGARGSSAHYVADGSYIPFHPVRFTEETERRSPQSTQPLPCGLHVSPIQIRSQRVQPAHNGDSVGTSQKTVTQPHLYASSAFIQALCAKMQSPPTNIDVPAQLYIPSDALAMPIQLAREQCFAQNNLAQRTAAPELPSSEAAALGTFNDGVYLADLAQQYQARSAARPSGELFGKILRDRAIACRIAAEHPWAHFCARSNPVPQGFAEPFPALESFADFDGNFAQRRLYSELSYCINEAFQQFRSHSATDQLTAISPTVLQLASMAQYTDNPAQGFHVADSCYHLLQAGKYLATMCRGVKTGTKNFVEHSLQLAKSIVEHPWDAAKELAYNAVKAAGLALGAALLCSIENPTPLEREMQYGLVDKAIACAKAAYYDPEATIATITEMILGQAALTKVFRLCKTGAASAGRALTGAAQTNLILEDTRRAFLKTVGQPLSVPAGAPVAEYEAILAQYGSILRSDAGIKNFASKLKAGCEQEKIFAAGGTAAEQLAKENALLNPAASALTEGIELAAQAFPPTLAKQAAQLAQTERLRKNLRHLIAGELNPKGELKGYHASLFLPGAILEDLGTIDAFGARRVKIKIGTNVKETTIFNPALTLRELCTIADEAAANPIIGTFRPFGFIGQTKQGQLIELWFKKSPEAEKLMINSFYPINQQCLERVLEKMRGNI